MAGGAMGVNAGFYEATTVERPGHKLNLANAWRTRENLAMAWRKIFWCSAGLLVSAVWGADATPPRGRTVEVSFTVDSTGKVLDPKIERGDVYALNSMALFMVQRGEMNPKILPEKGQQMKKRVELFFPVEDDGEDWPANVTPPKPKKRVWPKIPFSLREQRVAGGVILKLTIDAAGRLKKCEVLRASHRFYEDEAYRAVKAWTFEPARRAGQPLEVTCHLSIDFTVGDHTPEWKWKVAPRPALDGCSVSGAPLTD